MIDELTEQSKLAREAAFELLLARAPLTAAALDRRHEQASVAAATSAHSPNGRRSPARVRALDHAAEYKQERDREAARKAATAKQLQLQEQRLPPRTLSASARSAGDGATRPTAVRPLRSTSPGGIWASNNRHIPARPETGVSELFLESGGDMDSPLSMQRGSSPKSKSWQPDTYRSSTTCSTDRPSASGLPSKAPTTPTRASARCASAASSPTSRTPAKRKGGRWGVPSAGGGGVPAPPCSGAAVDTEAGATGYRPLVEADDAAYGAELYDGESFVDAFGPCTHALSTRGMLSPNPHAEEMGFAGAQYVEPDQPKHVMLEVLVGRRLPIYVRHPGSLPALRSRLAKLLGMSEASLRVSAEVSPSDAKMPPDAQRPRLMRVRVSGRPMITLFDAFLVLVSWLDLIVAMLFCLFSLHLAPAPPPFSFAALLPLTTLYFNARAAFSEMRAEYIENEPLKQVLSRTSGEMVLLILFSLLGPDTVLFISVISLMPRGVRLSDRRINSLRTRAAIVSPLALDVPLLVVNVLFHMRTDAPYDLLGLLALGLNAFTLLIHTPIRLARILAAQRTLAERAEVQLQDHAGSEISVGDGATFDWKEPNVDEEKGGYAA